MNLIYEYREPSNLKRLDYTFAKNERIVKETDTPTKVMVEIDYDIYAKYRGSEDEYLYTRKIQRVRPKYLCLGGPLDQKLATSEEARKSDYIPYNASHKGIKPSMILVHKCLFDVNT